MKKVFIFLVSLSAFGSVAHASANGQMEFSCQSGNGGLQLGVNAGSAKRIGVITIDASGVKDSSGVLKCSGPQESAYTCSGKLKVLGSSNEFVQVEFVIPETVFQGLGGTVTTGSRPFKSQYFCKRNP